MIEKRGVLGVEKGEVGLMGVVRWWWREDSNRRLWWGRRDGRV